MSATETAAAPVAPVEEVKPTETTPAPAEVAPAVEEPKVEATPAPAAVSHRAYLLSSAGSSFFFHAQEEAKEEAKPTEVSIRCLIAELTCHLTSFAAYRKLLPLPLLRLSPPKKMLLSPPLRPLPLRRPSL